MVFDLISFCSTLQTIIWLFIAIHLRQFIRCLTNIVVCLGECFISAISYIYICLNTVLITGDFHAVHMNRYVQKIAIFMQCRDNTYMIVLPDFFHNRRKEISVF